MTSVKLDPSGLVPAVCQDAKTGHVLTLAYMDADALRRTLEEREVWFYSRSRQELWHKGETSGNVLRLKAVSVDCDGDALLLQVEPAGPACHTGNQTCFFTPLEQEPGYERAEAGPGILQELFAVIQSRKREMPTGSYTTRLFQEGRSRIAQKVIEEAGETALAAAQGDIAHLPAELADLLYHALVLLADAGLNPEEVWAELRKRRK
ncbi:MAG: bifunctional phosphoribosyl-AMP cyclohydrolase/phosphoribosyl-ATP diphosphatase HisIE [Chloroflexi bacterium]|nr:bifunctional phosphoribosyl-AMP cyclohydrolase/phosphoribosyl-ATP diphosphatase HisIE [Chloroflexota bacterium]